MQHWRRCAGATVPTFLVTNRKLQKWCRCSHAALLARSDNDHIGIPKPHKCIRLSFQLFLKQYPRLLATRTYTAAMPLHLAVSRGNVAVCDILKFHFVALAVEFIPDA